MCISKVLETYPGSAYIELDVNRFILSGNWELPTLTYASMCRLDDELVEWFDSSDWWRLLTGVLTQPANLRRQAYTDTRGLAM